MSKYSETQLLEALLRHFWADERGRRLEWQWEETVALHEVEDDPELAQALYDRRQQLARDDDEQG